MIPNFFEILLVAIKQAQSAKALNALINGLLRYVQTITVI